MEIKNNYRKQKIKLFIFFQKKIISYNKINANHKIKLKFDLSFFCLKKCKIYLTKILQSKNFI